MVRAVALKSWLICFLAVATHVNFSIQADEWPQILGVHRDGKTEAKLPAKFPPTGPQAVWTAPVGQGYAGPVVAGDRVILFHRVKNQERVEAFDARSGKSLWATNFPATYRGGIDADLGPRCVPIVQSNHVYVYGAAGDCHCLELADGKPVWSRSLAADFNAPDGYFGAGSTPIVIGEVLLVNVGGKKGGIVGLDTKSGKTLWTATTDAASYSSPVLRSASATQAVFVTRTHVLLADALTGKSTKLFDFGRPGPTVNAAMPVVVNDHVFVTASYGAGAVYAKLVGDGADEVWSSDDSLSSQYSTPVHVGGYLYGIHGREDIPPAHLRCVELATGKVQWTREAFGVAHVITDGERLLLLTVEGELVLADASPKAYQERSRTPVAKGITRAIPAYAYGSVYFRSGDKLTCLKIGE